ncbi:MAG: hypothetical protein Kow001_14350 [Acidobacteriota bacterium]
MAWLEVSAQPDGSVAILERLPACIRVQQADERILECRLPTLQHDEAPFPGHGNLPAAGVDATGPISLAGPTSVWWLPV